MEMAKPKVAFYWCGSCGGCEEAVVDLAEDILKVVEAVDIVLWPVALDFKLKDVWALESGEIAVTFINGSVRLSEHEEWVKLLREKSQLVVAFGSCSHLGGIPGLVNLNTAREVMTNKYENVLTVDNPDKIWPSTTSEVDGYTLELPQVWNSVKRLDEVIDVDYYLPGCSPPPDLILGAVEAILKGELPPKGSILSPAKSLCETCPLNETKPEDITIAEFKRVATSQPDPEECYLAQGFVCLGPATRGGCGERCIRGNMPCRGCFGPPPGAMDQGTKLLSALASAGTAETSEAAAAVANQFIDPAGTLYRFSLPSSILKRGLKGQ
jgi:F420-non-reducing hydrogenase small subunit